MKEAKEGKKELTKAKCFSSPGGMGKEGEGYFFSKKETISSESVRMRSP